MKNILNKISEVCKKISKVTKMIFGYGVMIALFAGGLTFFGYVAALIIGGDTGALIAKVIYKHIIPVIIYMSTTMILLGLVSMYLAGEYALTSSKKKETHSEGER
ncbi:MAG: hypothetical protein E7649_07005 [Ruminococcaceae bacterium]|nr:hypothetical protein [Oscillospiraceae bacterium]